MTEDDLSKDAKELLEEIEARNAASAEIISVKDGVLTVNLAYEYEIELSRCSTYEAILAWVLHLSSKMWMTQEATELFIRTAMDENGLETPSLPSP